MELEHLRCSYSAFAVPIVLKNARVKVLTHCALVYYFFLMKPSEKCGSKVHIGLLLSAQHKFAKLTSTKSHK